MKSLFIYFFCIVGTTIWFSKILNDHQVQPIKFTPVKKQYPEKIIDNKIKNLLSKFVTQQKINELDTETIRQNLKIIKTKHKYKNEFNYQNYERYYAEWH